jgi:hypothetical protein
MANKGVTESGVRKKSGTRGEKWRAPRWEQKSGVRLIVEGRRTGGIAEERKHAFLSAKLRH